MPRVDLRDGQWAELRERINHAADKRLKVASRRARNDDTLAFDFETEVVREFVREWNVADVDGAAIAIADSDAIERAPDDIVEALVRPAVEAWTGATIPNVPTPPSSDA